MDSNRKRYITIDIMRAIAIVLVVIGHFSGEEYPIGYQYLVKVIYSFHMPLFMFISGFIYMATKRDISYLSFLSRKFMRLMVPYFSTSIIIITIKLLMQGHASVEHPVTIEDYITILYSPSAGYFLWFIWALWWAMMLIGLFQRRSAHLVMFVLSFVTAFLSGYFPEIFCLRQFASMWVYFMAGVVLFDWVKNPNTLIRMKFIIASSLIFISFNLLLIGYDSWSEWLRILISLPTAFCGVYLSAVFCRFISRVSLNQIKLTLISLAGASYIVYLFHTTFEGFAKAIAYKLMPGLDMGIWYMFMPVWIFVVAFGVLVPWWLGTKLFISNNLTRILFGLPIRKT